MLVDQLALRANVWVLCVSGHPDFPHACLQCYELYWAGDTAEKKGKTIHIASEISIHWWQANARLRKLSPIHPAGGAQPSHGQCLSWDKLGSAPPSSWASLRKEGRSQLRQGGTSCQSRMSVMNRLVSSPPSWERRCCWPCFSEKTSLVRNTPWH